MSLPATSFRPRPSPPPLPSRRGAGLPRPPPPEGWSEARGSEVTPRGSAASRVGRGKREPNRRGGGSVKCLPAPRRVGGGGAGLPQDVRSPRRFWGVKFAAARPGVLSVEACVCASVRASRLRAYKGCGAPRGPALPPLARCER